MCTCFFERDFHAPTPHKPAQDLLRCVVNTCRQKGLRIVLALRVTHQDPTNQNRLETGFVPHTGLRIEFDFALFTAIPILDFQSRPWGGGIIQTLLGPGPPCPFDAGSSRLMGLWWWRRIPQLSIEAQAGDQMCVGCLTHGVKQLESCKTTIPHNDQLAIWQPTRKQPYHLPRSLRQ